MQSDYFTQDFKMEFLPDRTPFMYTNITDEFEAKLNKMNDAGSTLFSNILKMNPELRNVIASIGRSNKMLSVRMLGKAAHKASEVSEDMIYKAVDTFTKIVCDTMDKYPVDAFLTDDITPIYTSGRADYPDNFLGVINDATVSYDQSFCCYTVLVNHEVYDNCIKDNTEYFNYVCKDIMHGGDVHYYDEGHAVAVVDENTGIGPSVDRCNAVACSVAFGLWGIINMQKLAK
jgi:hypothetical protein